MDNKVATRADALVNSLRLEFENLRARKQLKPTQVYIFQHNLRVILQFIDDLSRDEIETGRALRLLAAIQASFVAGVFGEIDPEQMSGLWDDMNAAKAQSAIAGRKAKTAPQIQLRRQIIRENYRGKLATSPATARLVIEKCESIFKARGVTAYGVETIRGDIRALLNGEKSS